MLTKAERDELRRDYERGAETATTRKLLDTLDAKDAEIARLRKALDLATNHGQLAQANERIAELGKVRAREGIEFEALAANLAKAEAALCWYLGECERPHAHPRCGDGVYCAKCFARANERIAELQKDLLEMYALAKEYEVRIGELERERDEAKDKSYGAGVKFGAKFHASEALADQLTKAEAALREMEDHCCCIGRPANTHHQGCPVLIIRAYFAAKGER